MASIPVTQLVPHVPAAHIASARQGRTLPVLVVGAVLVLLWYALAVLLNGHSAEQQVLAPLNKPWNWSDWLLATWSAPRPVLPAPHQIAITLWQGLFDWPFDSPRSLLLQTWITAQATLLGFVLGGLFGWVLAALMVHARTPERALMPWVVASQTVPVLALAPIVLIILGSLGLSGLLPKAVIAMYLCFFPVTVAMVQGLRAPQRIESELLHTYAASRWQTFWLLRMPSALPYVFPALKVAVAAGLVGAMVAEVSTGAQGGLGARLLTASYYGNILQMWAALVMAALLGLGLTAAVALLERLVLRKRGGRPQ
ncbi:ABC transporter permease [Thiomonas bhubaneswarensis]|uniref:ABC-type nitrate/sulfonate/bicarbonate transport system, permease component n=1 Tax=Thiomonas bhubaneswarensis TaxID=339866 RepID=A0A0K6HRL9_9BURK|nr:ABC transporter permease [Thiomonas bhubaneswarensis]CUA93560.1 ABC-type nitrate/sulfonate/bicarbonate transport system, permease component [Thiomonas bhubaneswarensis]